MLQGRAVRIKDFGVFGFELQCCKENGVPHDSSRPLMTLNSHITHRHLIRPTFTPEGQLLARLLGVRDSNKGLAPADQNQVYSSSIKTVDLSIPEISGGSYLDEATTRNIVSTLFQGIADVCYSCQDFTLNMQVAELNVVSKYLSYTFHGDICQAVSSEAFEKQVI